MFTMLLLQDDNLLPREEKQEGAVSPKTYLAYFRALHNLGTAFVVIFLLALCQVWNIQFLVHYMLCCKRQRGFSTD